MTPARILRGWMTARGFGVHSPFAYRFIREVLFQPYAYYAYGEIESSVGKGTDDMKRLYRILLYFRPEDIVADGSNNDIVLVRDLVLDGIGGLKSRQAKRAAVITERNKTLSTDADIFVVFRPSECFLSQLKEKFDNAGCGMIFNGRRMAVGVADPKLPRQDYNIPI